MGFPPNSDHCLNKASTASKALSFEMTAPHGTRIYATLLGCRIDFAPEQREQVFAWLKAELQRLETFGSTLEDLHTCPDCHMKIKMVNNLPVFCTTCRGVGRVTQATEDAFHAAHQQVIAPPIPTEIRPPSFAPVIDAVGIPVAPTKVLVGKVQPDTDNEDFVAPLPGQEGFIGPLQQHQR
jgi:hypothetical protein